MFTESLTGKEYELKKRCLKKPTTLIFNPFYTYDSLYFFDKLVKKTKINEEICNISVVAYLCS